MSLAIDPSRVNAVLLADGWHNVDPIRDHLNDTTSSFTLDGSDRPPRTDRYTIGAVTKKDGDNWVFTATLNYAGHDLPIPLELPVKWAGDTPVITVDHVGIPGMSTYDARVMIVGNDYVGTWSHSDGSHAGKMWGHIEHATTQPAK